ncbi:hypothetical protein [Desulfitobacterium chlororespirans]|uniref:Uncharacterized protein n=1 Tax=Desulfitobacterium chlororespirans DSM 11544 TaxID=1121395 RepID=A0A1M7UYC9_9FIRM|nr:hypothetical protein [Desulfitobacterium chlororespirans]SHN87926.1 hypothetical protein SAMN02745215_05033 [Desulfitobacterium chlororespirans DSM 11544]
MEVFIYVLIFLATFVAASLFNWTILTIAEHYYDWKEKRKEVLKRSEPSVIPELSELKTPKFLKINENCVIDENLFDRFQLSRIRQGLNQGLDVSLYANPKFSLEQMLQIQQGLIHGIDVSIYAKPEYDELQMEQILSGLVAGEDISDYADPSYSATEMALIRYKENMSYCHNK